MNKVMFGTVREDPQWELQQYATGQFEQVHLVGSGGCTAFHFASQFPDSKISLYDPNPSQISLIQRKLRILTEKNRSLEVWNSLNESGMFEGLFRQLRSFLFEFALSKSQFEQIYFKGSSKDLKLLFANPFWGTAFKIFFSDELLVAIFGPAAIQYAKPGSYPAYFQKKIEAGLLRQDRLSNYFLLHIFFGSYSSQARPKFLENKFKKHQIILHQQMFQDFDGEDQRCLVSLSNIFDWSAKQDRKKIGNAVAQSIGKGSCVLIRQLNNESDVRPFFGPTFRWQLAPHFTQKDRSLFYDRLWIGRKLNAAR